VVGESPGTRTMGRTKDVEASKDYVNQYGTFTSMAESSVGTQS